MTAYPQLLIATMMLLMIIVAAMLIDVAPPCHHPTLEFALRFTQ